MWLMGLWQWSGRKCCKQLCFSLVNKWTSRTGFDTFSGYTHTHAHFILPRRLEGARVHTSHTHKRPVANTHTHTHVAACKFNWQTPEGNCRSSKYEYLIKL